MRPYTGIDDEGGRHLETDEHDENHNVGGVKTKCPFTGPDQDDDQEIIAAVSGEGLQATKQAEARVGQDSSCETMQSLQVPSKRRRLGLLNKKPFLP